MNEFTKEELQIIGDSLLYFISLRESLKFKSIQVRDKVLYMIENYCDHEWQHSYKEKEFDICKKCGEEN
jgi:hypothetical protein